MYIQVEGSAMGNLTSPTSANFVMKALSTIVSKTIPFHILFIKVYIYDCVFAVPENHEIIVLNIFNQYHEKLHFTLEKESSNKEKIWK